MSKYFKIESITQLHESFKVAKPSHPLVSVIDLSQVAIPDEAIGQKMSTVFYNITLKTKTAVSFKYGREYFDFAEGVLMGIGPNQLIEVDETAKIGDMEGWTLYFHPDLIRTSNLIDKIEDYGFFSYRTNEALHLSDKEKDTLGGIIAKIVEEYESNIDEFSQGVLVANIELLLNYIKRFYNRQFITRKVKNTDTLSVFKRLLKNYFSSDQLEKRGLPKVHYFAEKLHLSDSYLSDLLKKETGKNTQDHIHAFVIEKAKNQLLQSSDSVSTIAYNLGFEYPQYFSRLFKKKTGKTPVEFRTSSN